jgi:hypothetical protein
VLVSAPVNFGENVGAFGPVAARVGKKPPVGRTEENVPGSFLNTASWMAAPYTFGAAPVIDRLASIPSATWPRLEYCACRTTGLLRRRRRFSCGCPTQHK